MKCRAFLPRFFLSLFLSTAFGAAALHVWGQSLAVWPAPRTELDDLSNAYLSAYTKGHTDHIQFRLGLLGFGNQIRHSDVLLMGTSHMEFGISAKQLSRLLSMALGRPISVFNAGLGWADGYGSARDIVEQNDLRRKVIVTDLFDPTNSGYSTFAASVREIGPIFGYYKVGILWTDFLSDWLKDPIVPRVRWQNGKATIVRQLALNIWRDRDTGDPVRFWRPDKGDVFFEKHPPYRGTVKIAVHLLPEEWQLTNLFNEEFCRSRGLRCVFTLVPYFGYPEPKARIVTVDNVGSFAAERHLNYLKIATDGLSFRDNLQHLDIAGRDIATRRLARQLVPLLVRTPKGSRAGRLE